MEIYMKAYKGTFKKKNGESRNMTFARLTDLPEHFLETRIIGAGSEQIYPEGMELVWDLEADNFRIFNWNTADDSPKELTIDESLFS
jgi:hypothetical protein